LPLGGYVTVENFDAYYTDQPDWQELAELEAGSGTIAWFGDGTQRPDRLELKNIATYKADSKQRLISRISLGSNSKNVDVIIEDCNRVFMDTLWCSTFVSRNVSYQALGTIAASLSVDWSGGGVSSVYNEAVGGAVPILAIYSTTLFLNVNNVRFALPVGADQSLYIANISNGTDFSPKVRVTNCRFRKDVTTGSPITLNADTSLFNTQNVMRFILDGNVFINTGSSTSQPIVRSMQRETGGNSVNVAVMGAGNFKTANLSANATTGVTTTNFSCVSYEA
jgi:hypothetical protein